jgi:hypothetical protein
MQLLGACPGLTGDTTERQAQGMTLTTWSWVLSALNILGLYLSWQVGNRRRSAWLAYVVIEAVWITYAIDTASWGFVVSATAYAAIALRNYIKWTVSPLPPQAAGPSKP